VEQELKDLITKIDSEGKFKVSYVLTDFNIGVVDSMIFNTYEEASKYCSPDQDIDPIILKK